MTDVVDAYRAALTGGELTEFPLTGYDRTGVPVLATVWDDGTHDAHGVGYGSTARAATIGALGELAERVVLTRTVGRLEPRRASYRELVDDVGVDAVADPLTLVLPAGSPYTPDTPLVWLPMRRWRTGEPVWAPAEFVASDAGSLPPPPPGGWLTTAITNGLGAGDTLGRAVGIDPVVKLASTEFVTVVSCHGVDDDPAAPPMAIGAVGEAAHPDSDEAIRKALLEFASSRARRVFAFGPLDRVRELHPGYLEAELRRPLGEQEPRALQEMTTWSGWDAATTRAAVAPWFGRRTRVVDPGSLPRAAIGGPDALLAHLLDRLAGFDVLVLASDPADGGPHGIRTAKVLAPGLEVETLSYHRIGERVARRLLDRGSPLVGRGAPDGGDRMPVRVTAAAEERLGGPVWFDRAAADATVGPLYSLYREPRRHAVGRLARD